MEKLSKLSLEEIKVLMDLTSGRVEDLECDDAVVPGVLRTLSEELTMEHVSRLEDKPEYISGNKILMAHAIVPVALVAMQDDCQDDGIYAVVTNLGFNPAEGSNELDFQYCDDWNHAVNLWHAEVERVTRRG